MVYLTKEIANVLRSVASGDTAAQVAYFEKNGVFHSAYHLGFQAALKAVGLAFGLEPMVDQEGDRGPIWIEGFTSE